MDRFYSKTKRNEENGCLEWQASRNAAGYGTFAYKGRGHGAHRIAWMLVNGEIPQGMCICHACDNPRCVDIDHLFLGTPADNNRDKINKGRAVYLSGREHPMWRNRAAAPTCERAPAAKLNSDKVKEIVFLLHMGMPQRKIADKYEVDQSRIRDISLGRTWIEPANEARKFLSHYQIVKRG